MLTNNFSLYNVENRAVKDAYALLTANINFSSQKVPIKTITICSCSPKVGKTTTAINLAISMASSGWNTLLVDADIRKPGNFKRLYNQSKRGLSDIIEADINLQNILSTTNIPNLSYLSSGLSIHNPIEIFCSKEFDKLVTEIREYYDFVLFDTPALSTVIDGALVAAKTYAVILVAEIGKTKLTSLNRAKEQLEEAHANILGVVMTRVKKRDYIKYMESYNYFDNYNRKVK